MLGLAFATSVAGCSTESRRSVVDGGAVADATPDAQQDAALDGGPPIALDLVRAVPDRGPFSGGQLVVLRGAGFSSSAVTVRFGEVAIPPTDVRRIDPNRLEVVAPAHAPGAVDVTVDDGTSSRTLEDAYRYDAVAITPGAGPPTGRTRLSLTSASDVFVEETEVRLDGLVCDELAIASPRQATCRTPAHPLGTVDVEVVEGASRVVLDDAFTYENPFRPFGGLGGGPLDGTLTVLVRAADGAPRPGALVIAGKDGALTHRARSGPDGTVVFTGDDLRGRVDVFVSDACHHHLGFIGLDAAYVTAGLRLRFLGCLGGAGDGGGLPPSEPTADLAGEIVFFAGEEFPTPVWEWNGVPDPAPGQRRVAYVGLAGGRDLLNGEGISAEVYRRVRVTDETRGARGFPFVMTGVRAASALVPFAVAGLETASDETGDASTPAPDFEPHVVGLGTPIVLAPTSARSDLEVRMDTLMGPGRRVTATAPEVVPTLGFPTGSHSTELGLVPVSLEQIHLLVQYAVPGIASGLPLGAGDVFDRPRSSIAMGASIPRQPTAHGSFAVAEQEVFVGLTGAPTSSTSEVPFYRRPHTRTLVRGPLVVSDLRAENFLGIPAFSAPATFDEPLPSDRTIRFTIQGDGATILRIDIVHSNRGEAAWMLLAHPDVEEFTLPDHGEEEDIDAIGAGRNLVTVSALDVRGLVFDRVDTRSIDSLPLRRTAMNTTSFLVE
jgi:hypothetical protein